MFYKTGISKLESPLTITLFVSLGLLILICMFPEMAFAADLSMENQLDKVNQVANNKFKVVLISVAAIFAGGIALIKGSLSTMVTVVAIVSIIGLTLEWVGAGMKFAL